MLAVYDVMNVRTPHIAMVKSRQVSSLLIAHLKHIQCDGVVEVATVHNIMSGNSPPKHLTICNSQSIVCNLPQLTHCSVPLRINYPLPMNNTHPQKRDAAVFRPVPTRRKTGA